MKAVYTGGYLVRNVEQVGDYTNYARGVYAGYYQCFGPTVGDPNLKPTCFSPSSPGSRTSATTHQQHELRFSTPDDWRLRAIAGAFWEDNKLFDQGGWNYKTVPSCTTNDPAGTGGNSGCFADIGTAPDATVAVPGIHPAPTSFYQDTMRETKQTAFFLSVDYDIIPKVLTITAGTRHFRFATHRWAVLPQLLLLRGWRAGRRLSRRQLRPERPEPPRHGVRFQEPWQHHLAHHAGPDGVLHVLPGFPPRGFNQNGGTTHAPDTTGTPQYLIPSSYQSDKLTNNEIGWKTEFLGHRLQWNGAIYRENWDNVQVAFFDPGLVGNIFYNTNGQNFLIKGVETSLMARVISGLTVQGAASWNQSRQTNSPQLLNNNPASLDYGKPITQSCLADGTGCSPITNPFGTVGSPSANAPPMQFSARARYEWAFADMCPTCKLESPIRAIRSPRRVRIRRLTRQGSAPAACVSKIQPIPTVDASVGVSKDALVRKLFRREPQQLERQHIRQHGPVHRRADAAAATRGGRADRLQVLS